MKVTFDKNGYVDGWCDIGDNGGVEVYPPEDLEHFIEQFASFHLVNGKLVLDEEKEQADHLQFRQDELRMLREKECFSVINRGWIWYSSLTLSQWRELRNWYLAWLNVTKTMTIPDRPSWVDNIDTSRIPLTPMGFL